MNDLKEFGVVDAIVKHLKSTLDKKKGSVVEINCGKGEFAEVLKEAGITRYQGFDPSKSNVLAASKIKGFTKKFKQGGIQVTETLKTDKDSVLLCLNGIDYDKVQSGQRMVVVTRGAANWHAACEILSPLFRSGASTVQHGNVFLTTGVRA